MKSVCSVLTVLFLTTVPSFVSLHAATNSASEIDGVVAPFANRGYFYGVVLVEEHGGVVFEKAYGMANAELGVPNRVDTRIGIASITKPMTDIILLRLVEAGKVHFEDTVSRYLPDFPRGGEITVSMLAHHRAGIPHRVMPPEQEAVPHSTSDMLEWIAKANLEFEPGSQRSYSSAGYTLLVRVLELASGRSYTQLLQQYVFDPAQMEDSMEFEGAPIMKNRAAEYILSPAGPRNAALKDYSFLAGAGSVFGTARDLYRFSKALLDGTYGEAARDSLVTDGNFEASGRTNGHRAYLSFDAEKESGFVLLANLSTGAFDLIAQRLSDRMAGKHEFQEFHLPELATDSTRDLTEFVGTYDRKDGGAFHIVLEDGVLHSGDIGIYPTTESDCFFDFSFFGNVCFGRDETGAVDSIDWKGGNFELRGIKKAADAAD